MRRIALLTLFTLAAMPIQAGDSDGPHYTANGSLLLPASYREWIFLSSGLGMTYGPAAPPGARPRFDNVFVSPPAYQAFMKTGAWPDRTMFVLEVRSSESTGSINNGGSYQGEVLGIESEVKDAGKWIFYSFGRSGREGKPFARSESCYSCHAQHGAVDNTFVQFYPSILQVAREKGTLDTSRAK